VGLSVHVPAASYALEHPYPGAVMLMIDRAPEACWDDLFVAHGEHLASQGLGAVTFAAPFIPTLPGSDRYSDELW
jgi:hypothetical protein